MNKNTQQEMSKLLYQYFDESQCLDTNRVVLDVGSYDMNGSLKERMPAAWTYIGLDLMPGPNVDVVLDLTEPFPIDDESIDLIVSSSCFQYVSNPFKYMDQLYKCLKPGGMIYITAASKERPSPAAKFTKKERIAEQYRLKTIRHAERDARHAKEKVERRKLNIKDAEALLKVQQKAAQLRDETAAEERKLDETRLIRESYGECWRYLKGGMLAILEESGFTNTDVYYRHTGCWGVGRKP